MEELSCQEDSRFFAVASLLGASVDNNEFLDPEIGEKDKEAVDDNRRVNRHKEEGHGNSLNRVGVGV